MISTSDGSQPSPKDFLDRKVGEIVAKLQEERIPRQFKRLTQGEESQDFSEKMIAGTVRL